MPHRGNGEFLLKQYKLLRSYKTYCPLVIFNAFHGRGVKKITPSSQSNSYAY